MEESLKEEQVAVDIENKDDLDEQKNGFQENLRKIFGLQVSDPSQLSPLVLAYIGDGVYEMVVRSYLISKGNAPVNHINTKASKMVKASAQAAVARAIAEELTVEENSIYRRGRNAKSYTMAKNATMADYRHATGLEALCGYLYLKQSYDRLLGLLQKGMSQAGLTDSFKGKEE